MTQLDLFSNNHALEEEVRQMLRKRKGSKTRSQSALTAWQEVGLEKRKGRLQHANTASKIKGAINRKKRAIKDIVESENLLSQLRLEFPELVTEIESRIEKLPHRNAKDT